MGLYVRQAVTLLPTRVSRPSADPVTGSKPFGYGLLRGLPGVIPSLAWLAIHGVVTEKPSLPFGLGSVKEREYEMPYPARTTRRSVAWKAMPIRGAKSVLSWYVCPRKLGEENTKPPRSASYPVTSFRGLLTS